MCYSLVYLVFQPRKLFRVEKGRKKKQELRKTRKDEGSSDNPSGFLYYGHLFSMYIEIFDMLTHETVE